MMRILLVFALVANLEFLLVDGSNTNESHSFIGKKFKHGTVLPRTLGGRVVEGSDYIHDEKQDMVKSLNMEGLLGMLDQFIPGVNALKDPIKKTVKHLTPILKVSKSLEVYYQTKGIQKTKYEFELVLACMFRVCPMYWRC